MSAPNRISARLINAVPTPTVAKIWICGSAFISGWMIVRCISAPRKKKATASGSAARYGCRPNWLAMIQVA